MSSGFSVGDVVLLPPPKACGYSTLDGYIAVVTQVCDDEITTCDNNGRTSTFLANMLNLLDSHTNLIEAITKKGVELVGRVSER